MFTNAEQIIAIYYTSVYLLLRHEFYPTPHFVTVLKTSSIKFHFCEERFQCLLS
ncbi:unnamed protein product [Tenebrio molitor]|nr:unnamed protein product [Tenebrio molitor]